MEGRQPDTGALEQGGRRFSTRFGLAIVVTAIILSISTYLILSYRTPIIPTSALATYLFIANFLLLGTLVWIISAEIWQLWRARVRRVAGARLHIQIVGLFSVIAILPAIIFALFSSDALSRTMDALFSKRTESIVINSLRVAQAYLEEHGQVIRSDLVAMANDVDRFAGDFTSQRTRFESELFQQAQLRNLQIARIIDARGQDLLPAANPLGLPPQIITPELLQAATQGEVAMVAPSAKIDQVGAIKRLANIPDAFLYVAREVNSDVMNQVRATERHEAEFRALVQGRDAVKLGFSVMQFILASTLLLSSIWMGLWFANRLVAPIRRLISAAQRVSLGDLEVQLEERRNDGDLANLARTFNHMTGELKKQRNDLLSTNNQLTDRKQFIEAVLSGVSAGVIGIDRTGRIDLVNRAALTLLGRNEQELVGQLLTEVVPEFGALARALLEETKPSARADRTQAQVDLVIGGSERHFAVQVTRESANDRDASSVLTFDDITGLVTAQRSSAWSDVARRIAHEIKNPLTPIQLSAERLKRKFGPAIAHDREIFDKLTETIVNRVGDLGRMVDEFSSFARMPKPAFAVEDIGAVLREATVLDQLGRSDVDIDVVVPVEPVIMACDRRLMTQAIINLVKNAAEAIQAVRDQPDAPADYRGRIEARLDTTDETVTIAIIDNGCGLPKKDRQRLVEPYNTTRAKGTGIGLAIVQKVTEQHGGQLLLEDAPLTETRQSGAAIRMVLPRQAVVEITDSDEAPAARSPAVASGAQPAGLTHSDPAASDWANSDRRHSDRAAAAARSGLF